MIERLKATACRILAESPGPVVRYRLMRDVLRMPPDDPRLLAAKSDLDLSVNVQELVREQWEDGSWGRFHTTDYGHKQKIPTTEVGVQRALSLGLDPTYPALAKAKYYILKVMGGEISFPDRAEVNDRWDTGVRLFLASTLSRINPEHPVLEADRHLWAAIAARTFQNRHYDPKAEIQGHAELTGANVKDSYLRLNGKYQLNLLGSIPGTLSRDLENRLLAWLWGLEGGIGYLGVPLYQPPPFKPGPIDRWLASLEILAHGFPTWVDFGGAAITWLWEQQDGNGYWDFGPRPHSNANLPLSDSWRRRSNRIFDWTTRVLVLLRQYYV